MAVFALDGRRGSLRVQRSLKVAAAFATLRRSCESRRYGLPSRCAGGCWKLLCVKCVVEMYMLLLSEKEFIVYNSDIDSLLFIWN